MPEFEHHVVGHIDRGRDGADTRQQQAALHPPRRHRGRVDTGDRTQPEALHAGTGLHGQRPGFAFDGQRLDVGQIDVVQVEGARDLARQAAHRQAVAAVRRHREVEHHVVETQHVGRRGARFGGARRQHDDAGMVGAEVQLGGRADHAVRKPAVGLARRDGEVAGQRGAGQGHHDQVTDREIACTARCRRAPRRRSGHRRRPCTPGWAS